MRWGRGGAEERGDAEGWRVRKIAVMGGGDEGEGERTNHEGIRGGGKGLKGGGRKK